MGSTAGGPHRVLIAGGGVAALEAALALRTLAAERVETTILSPQAEFVNRPMTVREPFGFGKARHYSLSEIARDIGATLKEDAFKRLEASAGVVHTEAGEALSYDSVVLALGAIRRPHFRHALTLDDARLDEQLHGLIQDVEAGDVRKLAFVIPSRMPWPLPIYELALMTARRAYDANTDVSITIVTPEDAPLALFGQTVSDAVAELLAKHEIPTIPSAHAETPEPGQLSIHPGSRRLFIDRVIALPELYGPPTAGVPKDAPNGFIPIDVHCRVRGLEHVYAAGDATDFAVKHGGIAAQQADTAAAAIAAEAGASVEPQPFHPVIHALLLGGEQPLYLSAQITGGHGSASEISHTPAWDPPSKIVAKYLAPYLDERDRAAGRTT